MKGGAGFLLLKHPGETVTVPYDPIFISRQAEQASCY
jgi:hypothetical protein